MSFVAACARGLTLLLFLAGFLAISVAPAFAHVELATSNPADGATLLQSPSAIELTFTDDVALAGEGLSLVNAAGESVAIDVQQTATDRLTVMPAVPLQDGGYAVLWTVRAGDAHPRSGSVAFAVAGPAPGTAPGSTDGPVAPSEGFAADVEPFAATASAAPVPFVVETDPPPGDGIARLGRWLSMLGSLVGIGVIVFAATTLVGTQREVAEATFWLRRSGVAVMAGTGVEVLGMSMMLSGSVLDAVLPSGLLATLISPFGVAVALRMGGGVALLRGASIVSRPADIERAGSRKAAPYEGSPSGGVATQTMVPTRYRMDLSGSALAIAGGAAVALSHLFDGHTVTTAPAVVVRISAVTHVGAAGVWVGGVLMLAQLLTWRKRRGVPLRAAELAVRFSRVAAVALGAVAVAGFALTWAILDAPGELVSTAWGRFLLLKMALVGVAVGLGGYNHHFVVPHLDADGGEEEMGERLRRVVRVEGAILVGVIAATAALVGAAS